MYASVYLFHPASPVFAPSLEPSGHPWSVGTSVVSDGPKQSRRSLASRDGVPIKSLGGSICGVLRFGLNFDGSIDSSGQYLLRSIVS